MDEAVLALADSSVASTAGERLLRDAINSRAATIHLEPGQELAQIRYRIDGLLHECSELSHGALATLVAHLKHRAHLLPDENRWPQEGNFAVRLKSGDAFTVNVATLPLAEGEKAVVQLVKHAKEATDLTSLGIWGTTHDQLGKLLGKRQGLIVVGSARKAESFATLRSIAQLLEHPTKSIVSIGTTPLRIKNVHHLYAHKAHADSVLHGLRAAEKADANVIVVDALRSSAEITAALDTASRGHLVVAAMPAASLAHAINHLEASAKEPHMLAHLLMGILHQRSVRQLCEHCKINGRPNAQLLKRLTGNNKITIETLQQFMATCRKKDPSLKDIQLFEANEHGCTRCRHTGYSGETGLFELLTVGDRIGKMISGRAHALTVLHQAIKEGMMPQTIDGLVKAFCGATTLDEVVKRSKD